MKTSALKVIISIIVLLIIIILCFRSTQNNYKILQSPCHTYNTSIEFQVGSDGQRFLNYTYFVDGKRFKGWIYGYGINEKEIINKKFKVKYMCNDPSKSTILIP